MGKRGPKPASNHLKVLRGDREHRLNRYEPIPSDVASLDLTKPPRGLGVKAAAVWRRLAPDLVDKGMLTAWDVDLFGAFCASVAQYNELERLLGRDYVVPGSAPNTLVKSPYWRAARECVDVMLRISSRFGFTPGDRACLVAGVDSAPKRLGPERLLT